MQFYIYRIDKKIIGAKWSRDLPCYFVKKNWDSSKSWPWMSSKNSSDTTLPNVKQTQSINKMQQTCVKWMHKIKEEVILRILAQESLYLELWLKRYGILKFQRLFCKIPRINEFRLIFELKHPWTESMGHGPQEPQSTVDRPPLLAGGAHRSPAYGLSRTLGRWSRGGGGGVEHGGPDGPLTRG
jgi:hypothetical protein